VSDLQAWTPLALAFFGFLTALFQYLGKKKAVKINEVIVGQIENFNDADLKKSIRDAADIHNVGDALHLIVDRVTK